MENNLTNGQGEYNMYNHPVCPPQESPAKPANRNKTYLIVLAAIFTYQLVSALATTVYNFVFPLIMTNLSDPDSVDAVCRLLLDVFNGVLFVFVPVLFAIRAYKSVKLRLALGGCFFTVRVISSALSSILMSLTAPIWSQSVAFPLNLFYMSLTLVISFASIAIEIVVGILLVRLMLSHNLFEQDERDTQSENQYSARSIPLAAGITAALTVLVRVALGKGLMLFMGDASGFVLVLRTVASAAVAVGAVIIAFAVGKRFYKKKDKAILFAVSVIGCAALNIGNTVKSAVNAVISLVKMTGETGGFDLVNTAVSALAVAINIAVAAVLAVYIFKRLEKRNITSQTDLAEQGLM